MDRQFRSALEFNKELYENSDKELKESENRFFKSLMSEDISNESMKK